MSKIENGMISIGEEEVFKEETALVSQGFAAGQGFPKLSDSDHQDLDRSS